jgi:hypothetical protein
MLWHIRPLCVLGNALPEILVAAKKNGCRSYRSAKWHGTKLIHIRTPCHLIRIFRGLNVSEVRNDI